MKEIDQYPYVATPERAARIVNGYKRITVGMTVGEVQAILGDADEIRPLYEASIKKGKIIGYTHWYVIRRLVKNGSVKEKDEAVVRIAYGGEDRVTNVDDWGLSP